MTMTQTLINLLKTSSISLLMCCLFACSTKYSREDDNGKRHSISPAMQSYLEQGKRDFQEGYYRSAMHNLLPVAVDGNAEGQYAVGYMYYYGYGVAQDTDVGYFWINRSARQGFLPATRALSMMPNENDPKHYAPVTREVNRDNQEKFMDIEAVRSQAN